jgi:hypothetical protein
MRDPDLRILALADAKLLPSDVQDPFDHWRIWRARDAVATLVHKRILNVPVDVLPIVQMYLDRLDKADTEQMIFEGIYALAEVVDVHRKQLGLHGKYIVLIMSSQINPWGVLSFQQDFENPTPGVVEAARELWKLAQAHKVDVEALLTQIKNDDTLTALQVYYTAPTPTPESTTPSPETQPNTEPGSDLINKSTDPSPDQPTIQANTQPPITPPTDQPTTQSKQESLTDAEKN